MTSTPDPELNARWDQFEARLVAATEQMRWLGATEIEHSAAVHAIDDGDEAGAIMFIASAVHHGDGRAAARTFAELLIPEVELLLGQDTELGPTTVVAVQAVRRRLCSVLAEQDAGTAVPESFRSEFEAWWSDLEQGGDLDAAVAQAQDRLDALPAGAPERHWIHLILVGWLELYDQWRWQPALMVLDRENVTEAAPTIRAVSRLAGPEKQPFIDRFDAIADRLEQAGGT